MSLGDIVRVCLVVYLVAAVIDLVLARRVGRFLLELGALILVVILALLVNNANTGRVAFGEGTTPVGAVAWMFLATLLGIAARYVFYLDKGQFSVLSLFKPIAISPIVLLPLIGSVQGAGDMKEMQMVSFAFLAFQNGFFWQAVLDSSRPNTLVSGPRAGA
jgi:hypothetical protein